jgi:hypothetical protein
MTFLVSWFVCRMDWCLQTLKKSVVPTFDHKSEGITVFLKVCNYQSTRLKVPEGMNFYLKGSHCLVFLDIAGFFRQYSAYREACALFQAKPNRVA